MRRSLLTTFLVILFILLVAVLVVVSSLALERRTSFFGQASSSRADSLISADNSYLFVSPLSALAGGSEKIRVTVFILNGNGLGVSGKKVSLIITPSLNIDEAQSVTDSYGKAVFDISAQTPGEYTIRGEADSVKLPQNVKVSFR